MPIQRRTGEGSLWYGLLAQSRTPAPALETLRAAVTAAQRDPEFAARVNKFGINAPEAGAESQHGD